MATKRKPLITSAPQLFVIPEGFAELPTALLLYHEPTSAVWGNPQFERVFGKALSARFQTKKSVSLIHERPVTASVFTMIGRHEGYVLDTTEGKLAPVELRVNPYGQNGSGHYLIMIEEVTQKLQLEKELITKHLELERAFQDVKRSQDALVQSAKLASIGELTSGIAHELNQPLQAIIGFTQELAYLEPLSPTGVEFANDVINAAKKMAEIIKSLRSFSRQSGDEFSLTSIDDAIVQARKLTVYSLMQENIELKVENLCDDPRIRANAIQLEQVFVNLITNARDAITSTRTSGGVICIQVRNRNEQIEVSVSDNGCGMAEETKQRIFDPFFTTKDVGKGTGLGLSISYGILKKFNAKIEVVSKVGSGTTFQIAFLRGKNT